MSKNKKITPEDVEAALDIVLELLSTEQPETQTWGEHIAATNKAEEAELTEKAEEEQVIDLSMISLTDKFGYVINNTLDQLLIGNIMLENAQELRVLLDTVTEYNHRLKGSKSNA